jgi:hypothetical protein
MEPSAKTIKFIIAWVLAANQAIVENSRFIFLSGVFVLLGRVDNIWEGCDAWARAATP